MATTTNFGWTTPDDTSLVKDGAAAIRSLGSAIDTSMMDLKGGTTGQSLTKNSNTDMDFVWATPAGGTTWSLVNAGGTSLTGAATITVSGITKDNIFVYVNNASSASSGSTLSFRFNSDSTSKYSYAGLQLRSGATYTASGGSATINSVESAIDGQNKIEWVALGTSAANYADGFFKVSGAKNTIKVHHGSVGVQSTANDHRPQVSGGIYTGSTAISTISIISSVGNFDGGTIYVYEG